MGRERNLIYDDRQKDMTPTTNIKGAYNDQGIRRMTPREWGELQGYPTIFPDELGRLFKIPVADASISGPKPPRPLAMRTLPLVGRTVLMIPLERISDTEFT